MVKIVYSRDFLKSAKRLPSQLQEKLGDLLEICRKNPFHPRLHTKMLKGKLAGFYSFRLTREWRVIFLFQDEETIHLIKVGHRKEIYKKL